VRDLTERLTELQHELGEQVRATLHVHINHDLCLEVIVIRGRSDLLQGIADRLLALRGVKQGGIEIVTGIQGAPLHEHSHQHGQDLEGPTPHNHGNAARPNVKVRYKRRTLPDG
jgi:CopG family transcriptional regulator, nickel-responsive regulator